MKIIVPPIKSQGIKSKLVPWISECVKEVSGRWVEPFLGTGVVAFSMRPKNALLCDVNPHIINFYKAIQNGDITAEKVREYLTREGERLRTASDNGYAYFREVRDRFNTTFEPLDFLFLSRSGFNGMMRFNKKGEWNIPFCQKPDRFRQAHVTKIANQVAAVAGVIRATWEFKVQDFRKTLEAVKPNDFLYCDPPYYGRHTDYYNSWTEVEERALSEALQNMNAPFILSTWHHNNFRSNEMIDKYWKRFHIEKRNHFYHSGARIENRNAIVEALVMNYTPNKTRKLEVVTQANLTLE